MAIFVEKIELSLAPKLKSDLVEQDFEFQQPQYTLFQARKKGLCVTLYESGKLVVQGKEMKEFIEFYLEPELLKSFNFSYKELELDQTPRIGIDESGKGDFFGPLVIGGVQAGGSAIVELQKAGVMDSKKLTDDKSVRLAAQIKKLVPWQVVRLNPAKYNELYEKFANLNHLLAWGHATVIEKLNAQTGCVKVIVDQFASEWVVEKALSKKGLELDLTQRTKAESDVVVAAASILARAAFLEGLHTLSTEWNLTLPKGASKKVLEVGRTFVRTHGREALANVSKGHFKTTNQILGS